jgi:flagellar export protein FliJ
MLLPKTRLDRLVQVRERTEDRALSNLAQAREILGRAQQSLFRAAAAAKADHRGKGHAAHWDVEEAAHVRALQSLRNVRGEVSQAAAGEAMARKGYVEARKQAESARRVAERKRAEMVRELAKADARRLDEIGTLAFNRGGSTSGA